MSSYLWDSTIALWQIFLHFYMFPCPTVEHFGPHMLKFSYICHIHAQLRMLLGEAIVYNIFTTNYKLKVFICSNLNLLLKLIFCPSISTHNNLSLWIFCENIVDIIFFCCYIFTLLYTIALKLVYIYHYIKKYV